MSEEYPAEAEALVTPWFMDHTKGEIMELCTENRIPCVPVRTMDEVMENPHLNERGFFQGLDHPKVGTLKYAGAPYHFSQTPWRLVRPAPTLGQHNREVLCDELGYNQEDLVQLSKVGII